MLSTAKMMIIATLTVTVAVTMLWVVVRRARSYFLSGMTQNFIVG